jgi:hypothetical protein
LFEAWPVEENAQRTVIETSSEWHDLSLNFMKPLELLTRLYKMLQAGLRPPPGFFLSTDRIASSKTVAKFVFFFAEHSTKQNAPIFDLSFLASADYKFNVKINSKNLVSKILPVVTNLSEPCTRKSAFVPVQLRVKR